MLQYPWHCLDWCPCFLSSPQFSPSSCIDALRRCMSHGSFMIRRSWPTTVGSFMIRRSGCRPLPRWTHLPCWNFWKSLSPLLLSPLLKFLKSLSLSRFRSPPQICYRWSDWFFSEISLCLSISLTFPSSDPLPTKDTKTATTVEATAAAQIVVRDMQLGKCLFYWRLL